VSGRRHGSRTKNHRYANDAERNDLDANRRRWPYPDGVIGWLILAAWMGALSVHRFVVLANYPENRHRVVSYSHAVALASLAISMALLGLGAPKTLAGFFFVAAGLISVVMLVALIARGIRPRRIRHAWREIGDPDAWRGHPQAEL
jgi:hypothetical protein